MSATLFICLYPMAGADRLCGVKILAQCSGSIITNANAGEVSSHCFAIIAPISSLANLNELPEERIYLQIYASPSEQLTNTGNSPVLYCLSICAMLLMIGIPDIFELHFDCKDN